MKIAFVAGTLGQGGAEKQLFLLASELNKRGDQVQVYCLSQGEFWEEKFKQENIRVIHIGKESARLKRLRCLFREIKAYQPEVLYSFHFYTSFYAAIVGRLLGIFSIGSIRNDGHIEKSANGFFSYLHYHLPHAIIANSQHGLKNSQKIFLWKRKRVGILTNALDIKQVVNKRLPNTTKTQILFVGRLVDQKRPMLFLEILAQLKSKFQFDFEATVLGDGPLKSKMIDFCKATGIETHVKLAGKVSNVLEYMTKSSLLLCTSAFEGTPNVILEAMAMELPVVSANFEGVKIILGNNQERGLVFNTADEAAKLIYQFDRDQATQSAQRAKEMIITNYLLEGLSSRFYQELKKVR